MILQKSSRCHGATLLFCVFGLPLAAADAPSGVKSFSQVNEHIYRGAQPSSEGFESLAKLGVKTVIDLREPGGRSRREAKVVQALNMHYVNIPLDGFNAPTNEEVLKVLALLDDPSAGPVFIHCRRGADRTGTMIAIYRIGHDHWDNKKALAEATSFKMAGWERRMRNFVLHYQHRNEPTPAPEPQSAVVTAATSSQ